MAPPDSVYVYSRQPRSYESLILTPVAHKCYWHIPKIPTSRSSPHSGEILHVLFLERLSQDERSRIIERLNICDIEWAQQFDPDVKPRKLRPVPWVRDCWPSSDAILQYTYSCRFTSPYFLDFIIVDCRWDTESCIAARWCYYKEGSEEMILRAARVPMSIANLLLTLVDEEGVHPLAEALGSEVYESSKVDFYKDRKLPGPFPEVLSYEPPSFLHQVRTLSSTKLIVISLQTLSHQDISSLMGRIVAGNAGKRECELPDIQIINWEGDPAQRREVPKLFHWLEHNDTAHGKDQIGYAFFVDNVMQSSDGGLQIVAASRTGPCLRNLNDHQTALLPIIVEKLIAFWKAAVISAESNYFGWRDNKAVDSDVESYCADIWRREYILEFDCTLELDDFFHSAVFFFLRPFTLDQERTIRTNVTKRREGKEGYEWVRPSSHESTFIPYESLWPNENQPKTLQDLRNLFEKSQYMSPFFDPTNTGLRLTSYPCHFFAVDERALDPEKPQVILATTQRFRRKRNNLGWLYAVTAAEEAHVDFECINMTDFRLSELVKGQIPERLWLSDLETYAKEDYDGGFDEGW